MYVSSLYMYLSHADIFLQMALVAKRIKKRFRINTWCLFHWNLRKKERKKKKRYCQEFIYFTQRKEKKKKHGSIEFQMTWLTSLFFYFKLQWGLQNFPRKHQRSKSKYILWRQKNIGMIEKLKWTLWSQNRAQHWRLRAQVKKDWKGTLTPPHCLLILVPATLQQQTLVWILLQIPTVDIRTYDTQKKKKVLTDIFFHVKI